MVMEKRPPYRIMVVESKERSLDLITSYLSFSNFYEICTAGSAQEAERLLTKAKEEPGMTTLDLLIVGSSIPDNGKSTNQGKEKKTTSEGCRRIIEFVNQIYSEGVPILVMADVDAESPFDILQLPGVIDYFNIPITRDTLGTYVSGALEKTKVKDGESATNPWKMVPFLLKKSRQYEQAVVEATRIFRLSGPKEKDEARKLLAKTTARAVREILEGYGQEQFSTNLYLGVSKILPNIRLVTSSSRAAVILSEQGDEKFVIKTSLEEKLARRIRLQRSNIDSLKNVNRFRRDWKKQEQIEYINNCSCLSFMEGKAPVLVLEFIPGETVYRKQLKNQLSSEEIGASLEQIARLAVEGRKFAAGNRGTWLPEDYFTQHLEATIQNLSQLGVVIDEKIQGPLQKVAGKLSATSREPYRVLFYYDTNPLNLVCRDDKKGISLLDIEERYFIPPQFVFAPFIDSLAVLSGTDKQLNREILYQVSLLYLEEALAVQNAARKHEKKSNLKKIETITEILQKSDIPTQAREAYKVLDAEVVDDWTTDCLAIVSPLRCLDWAGYKAMFAAKSAREQNYAETKENLRQARDFLKIAVESLETYGDYLISKFGASVAEDYISSFRRIQQKIDMAANPLESSLETKDSKKSD